MLPQVVVAIVALILTTLATAIALWECSRKQKRIPAPEAGSHELSRDDIRLEDQSVPPCVTSEVYTANTTPAEHRSHKTSAFQVTSESCDVESGSRDENDVNSAPDLAADRYSDAV